MNKQIHNTVYCITCAWVRVHIRKHAAQVPVGSIPCSSAMTSQNFAPIWFPHCPPLVQEGVTIDRPTSNKEADKCFAQTDIDTNLRYKSIYRRKETLSDTNFGACYHSVTPCTCTSSRMAPGSWNHKGHRLLLRLESFKFGSQFLRQEMLGLIKFNKFQLSIYDIFKFKTLIKHLFTSRLVGHQSSCFSRRVGKNTQHTHSLQSTESQQTKNVQIRQHQYLNQTHPSQIQSKWTRICHP